MNAKWFTVLSLAPSLNVLWTLMIEVSWLNHSLVLQVGCGLCGEILRMLESF